MKKEEIAKTSIELIKKYNNLALLWGTGVGKSKAAIDILKYLSQSNKLKVLLVVAERPHKQNWQLEFDKWGKDLIVDLTTICYASLFKYRNSQWDVIIYDEAHHLQSSLRLDIITSIKAVKNIFLSATLKASLLYELSSIVGDIKSFEVPLEVAIKSNMLPSPNIYLIPLTLDNTMVNHIIQEKRGKEGRRITIKCNYWEKNLYLYNKKKYPDLILEITCTAQQKYNYLTEKLEFYKKKFMQTRMIHFQNKWLHLGSERKQFLGICKTDIVKKFLKNFKNKRFICFCTNIKQAEELGTSTAIHSKNKNSQQLIDKFNNKEIQSLFAVGMLQEGQNLTDIELGIIIQLDGEERAFIQKFGRTLRAKNPKQYVFYFKDTKDEEYLNKIKEDFDDTYFKTINV